MTRANSYTSQAYFQQIADVLLHQTQTGEYLSISLDGEDSDFVRLNHCRVRQVGSVSQRYVTLKLIDGQKQISTRSSLSGERERDVVTLGQQLQELRDRLVAMPDDPYVVVPQDINSSEEHTVDLDVDAAAGVRQIIGHAGGLDLVGIWASGTTYAGFANSSGQRNWFSRASFHFDFSIYLRADKAVKGALAGLQWSEPALIEKLADMRQKLGVLAKPCKTLSPGRYRVFLTPSAIDEVMSLLAWGGFGLKARETKQTPLLRLVDGTRSLSHMVSIDECSKEGIGPRFTSDGFSRPDRMPLIRRGCVGEPLVSPRTALEYGVRHSGADASEAPSSLQMAAGGLLSSSVLERLGTGVYVGNLWYLNYSDAPSCRMTGMTRFATFWVEDGEIIAPIEPMRFDETLYRMWGENLEDLTREREWIMDAASYGARSTRSSLLPGALVRDFSITL